MNQLIQRFLSNRKAYHLAFWGTVFFLYLTLSSLVIKDRSISYLALYTLLHLVFEALPVYANLLILDLFFRRKKYLLYSFSLIVVITSTAWLNWQFFDLTYDYDFTYTNHFYQIVWFIIITTSIRVFKNYYLQRLELQELKTENLQTELNLLKAQINPHFLFNTMNNLYGLAKRKDDRVEDGIAQLSHLLRYVIYDSDVEKINLTKEVNQIYRLIELHKLRFAKEDNVKIDFRTKGDINGVEIPPMLLIPLVENAFKHGISLSKKSYVNIDLKIVNSELKFSVENIIQKKTKHINEEKSGLGLSNVKRRLELIYPDNHELIVDDNGQIYNVELKLKLKNDY
ncbi:sensor histidine kinase [Bacteroidota bacterium]